ncbi:outer membrane beta-barrel family protein [Mucilaginibacter glaciei]|uniref:TonB-dependent receptor n=1 Tax=Mucilaginibacter glaciei TaxID=2772109 RepID=A0A926S1D4_9SPHI|nr:outer membrane beta-barrel family protein [Mucilaginibacter glaciei]MBD1392682.1 TonB-dependent receptor [Mucilaginibacter glaciei]
MRFFLTLFLLLFISSQINVYAQAGSGKGKITGKVTDANTKLPVDYATVSLFKQGSASPFNGISTDAKGNFAVDNLPAGDYKLTVDFLGYTRTTLDHVIVGAGGAVSLGELLLKPVQNQLSTVVVTAKAPIIENKIDKMVYNAANDLTAQGGVALDVLKKVPQVSVDIDGNVELQGNANIRFLINGKPSSIFGASLADALQSIPASQIKSIEVVTSPGAKYDAAGTGGIINIILKDSKVSGINGSINGALGTRLENGSVNLSARKGNFGANAFFSGNAQLKTTGRNSNSRSSYDATTGDSTRLLQSGENTSQRSSYQTGLSLNWSITPKDELTGTFGFNHFGNHNYGLTSQQETQTSAAGAQLSQLLSNRISDSRFSANSQDFSLGYKKTFAKEGQELDILYNTSYSKNTVNYSQRQDYLTGSYPATGSIGSNPGNDRQTNISVDYSHPFSKNFTLEGGAKAVLEDLKNTVNTDSLLNNGSYVNNADQTYGFNYKRNIYAVYLSASASLFKNWLDVKAGVRNEYTNTTANFPGVNIPGYNTMAPSATLSHKLSGSQSIKLSYNYRIERPDYGEVNPFYNISDPHNISTGNPNLKPEVSHGLELGYNKSFDGGANIYTGAFYRHNIDDIQSFTTQYEILNINGRDYTNVLLTQRANIGTQTTVGANIFGSVPVTEKLNLRTNMFLASRTNTNPGFASVTGVGYRVNLNATYQFGNNLAAEGFVNYNSSQKNLQGTRPHFLFYNFAVRKQFLNKKASFGLVAANPFNKYVNQQQTTFGNGFNQVSLRQVPVQSFGITFSYKFGKLEFEKDKKDKDKGDDTNGSSPDAGGR